MGALFHTWQRLAIPNLEHCYGWQWPPDLRNDKPVFRITRAEHCCVLLGIAEYFCQSPPMAVPAITGTPEDWGRVAAALKKRRNELGLTQLQVSERSGASVAVVQVAEGASQQNGAMSLSKAAAISRALGWESDAIECILRGEEPVEVGEREEVVDLAEAVANLSIAVLALQQRVRELEDESSQGSGGRGPQPR
jgi:transcriptional regulator with XRE-family HTH domain